MEQSKIASIVGTFIVSSAKLMVLMIRLTRFSIAFLLRMCVSFIANSSASCRRLTVKLTTTSHPFLAISSYTDGIEQASTGVYVCVCTRDVGVWAGCWG